MRDQARIVATSVKDIFSTFVKDCSQSPFLDPRTQERTKNAEPRQGGEYKQAFFSKAMKAMRFDGVRVFDRPGGWPPLQTDIPVSSWTSVQTLRVTTLAPSLPKSQLECRRFAQLRKRLEQTLSEVIPKCPRLIDSTSTQRSIVGGSFPTSAREFCRKRSTMIPVRVNSTYKPWIGRRKLEGDDG
jgi:hypothetical protein